MDSSTFNAVFFLSLATMILGSFGLIIRYSLRSRCVKCSFCYGLVNITRDVQAELEAEQLELEHGINLNEPTTPVSTNRTLI
jgi:hypothetical protein